MGRNGISDHLDISKSKKKSPPFGRIFRFFFNHFFKKKVVKIDFFSDPENSKSDDFWFFSEKCTRYPPTHTQIIFENPHSNDNYHQTVPRTVPFNLTAQIVSANSKTLGCSTELKTIWLELWDLNWTRHRPITHHNNQITDHNRNRIRTKNNGRLSFETGRKHNKTIKFEWECFGFNFFCF